MNEIGDTPVCQSHGTLDVGPAFELIVDARKQSIQVTPRVRRELSLSQDLTLVLDCQVDELRGNLFQQPDHPNVDLFRGRTGS